jgi:replicative DNA helicase
MIPDCLEMPASPDSERSTLGAILLNGSCYAEAAQQLKADDFSLDSHRRIFRAITKLAVASETIDLLTVVEACETRGNWNRSEVRSTLPA